MTKLWGGRFSKKTDPLTEEFTKSIHFDYKLAEYDCLGSLTHIDILKHANLLTSREYQILEQGLWRILNRIIAKTLIFDPKFEDIHSYIQHLLENDKKVGKVALKLHTCRSRNDQVVFDSKVYCLENIFETRELILSVQKSILTLALTKKNAALQIPGYTHLQRAMPINLSDHLFAYEDMLKKDFRRLENIQQNLELSMGAGALAGTIINSHNYNVAVKKVIKERNIKILKPTTNPVYTVSDRDFVIETLSALAITGMHLSRLAEDFILWSTKEFNYIEIDESFCTGSSLMPQKKNPDVLELIRGYTGRLYGNLVNVLVMMKGLPLTYNRDMQHDKEPLFDSFEIVQKELKILAKLLLNVKFNKKNIAAQLEDETLYATDIADVLVQKGIAFKDAHTIVGRLIRYKLEKDKNLRAMTAEELKTFHPLLTPALLKKIIDPKRSVESKKSIKRVKRKLHA